MVKTKITKLTKIQKINVCIGIVLIVVLILSNYILWDNYEKTYEKTDKYYCDVEFNCNAYTHPKTDPICDKYNRG